MVAAQTSAMDSSFRDEKSAMLDASTLPNPVQAEPQAAELATRRKFRRVGQFLLIALAFLLVYNYNRFSRHNTERKSVGIGRHGCGKSPIRFPSLVSGASGWSDDGVNSVCVDSSGSWKTDGPFTGYGSRDVYSAHADFELASSFSNFIEAVGDLQHLSTAQGKVGSIAFVPAPPSITGTASIGVHVTYSDPSILDALRVCHVQAGDEIGLVLGAPWVLRHLDADPMFSIGIRVPIPGRGLSSELKTKLPGFVHDVYPGTKLDSLDIVTDQAVRFQAGSAANDISVRTSNSPITGFFNISSNLKLITSNAPIDVDVEAYHTSRHWPSTIRLATSNADLNATLALKNTTEVGVFRVFAQTFNSPVNVTLLESPINGHLRLEAKTQNAPARLELDSAFEGNFAAHTNNADPIVEFKEGVEDPAGEQRKRFVETTYVTPRVKGGSVAWGEPARAHLRSSALVAATNDPAIIVL